jgi:hypothetical protein
MSDWLRNATLYELNTWVWLKDLSRALGRNVSLGTVPDSEWDRLAELGMAAVWLMGVWERSPAGVGLGRRNRTLLAELRRALPDFQPGDLVGSPYAIRRFEVDSHLGGREGLARAREALAQRDIRLVLDFVPNHVAIDHPWVATHPDWFIHGSAADLRRAPNAFLEVGGRVFARGRDPYFPPWSDVLQLNLFNRELRRAAMLEVERMAGQCDAVRCDMAMLVLTDVFTRTWGKRAGAPPEVEYWRELIPAVKASHRTFRFIAEAYWDLEAELFEQGFDACYDKVLYDRMADGSAETISAHLTKVSGMQDRLVRFLENHDEQRAAHVFSGEKGIAAAVIFMTLPGIRLLHEGQWEGRTVRTAVHLGRRSDEKVNPEILEAYRRLLSLAAKPLFHSGQWSVCTTSGWPDNSTYRHLLSWCWRHGSERLVVVVNYSAQSAQGRLRVPWHDLAGRSWSLADLWTGSSYERLGDELIDPGLFVDLGPWQFHLLRFEGSIAPPKQEA